MKNETAAAFLRRHRMHYEEMPLTELRAAYRREMEAALAGEPSSLYMLPSWIRADAEPRREERVLVIDAGGTNLRAGLAHFDARGHVVVDAIKKRRMPGAGDEEVTAAEMLRQIAAFALEYAAECRHACISFSYICDILPGGDGRIVRLCKELRVRGAEGTLVCRGIENALRELGAPGHRSWKLINDSVGSLLGGMAGCDREKYADFIGFILGTGTNTCCCLAAEEDRRDGEVRALGGDIIFNMESGCFDKLVRGTADRELDAASELPGDHLAEKMISGSYYRQVLQRTLQLAAREGRLSAATGQRLNRIRIKSQHVDAFCLDPQGSNLIADALADADERTFAAELNALLLERAARVAAACLAAVIEKRALTAGSRVCVCADGTMLRLNPVLRPRMEAALRELCPEIAVDFLFAEDASLLGCAWAGLTE